VLDRPVLAGRIHGLEHEQQRPAILRIQLVLQLGQRLDAGLQHLLGARPVFVVQVARVAGIDVLQAELALARKPERIRELARLGYDFVELHAPPSRCF
jgi:hypothetical protein